MIFQFSLLLHLVREISRFRLNWVIICSMGYFYGVLGYVTAPSLHQFITSSSLSSSKSNVTSDSQVVYVLITALQSRPQVEWPGLGLSETWYSLAVSAQSIGIFVGALLFSVFARSFYYKYIIIGSLFIAISSGVIYGFAVQGWMVITGSHCPTFITSFPIISVLKGRFLSGVYTGISSSLARTYIGESSDKVIQMRKEASLNSDEQNSKKTSSLKYTNYFILFTLTVLGLASGPGK